jgi:hypothetical protein
MLTPSGISVFHTSEPSADESLEMNFVQVVPKPTGQAPYPKLAPVHV